MEFIWYGIVPSLLLFMGATTGHRVFIWLYFGLACWLVGADFHGIFLWVGCQLVCWAAIGILRFLFL